MSKKNILKQFPIVSIVVLGLFLRVDRIDSLAAFIGDQGWFFLSARDMILGRSFPLVGITSSHTWLHQGPLWTYMLAMVLKISGFAPVAGTFLTSAIGVISIFLVYKIGREFFSERFALVAAVFFATSPLVVIHDRFAYHTSPIPFVVLVLFYSVLRVLSGKIKFAPIAALSIAVLYNLELSTVVFIPVLVFLFVYGIYRKENWTKKLFANKTYLGLTIPAVIVPMAPILIYDTGHGFPQTLKYAGWFAFRMFGFLGLYKIGGSADTFPSVISFFLQRYQLLFFAYNLWLSLIVLVISVLFVVRGGIRTISKPIGVTLLFLIIPLIGFILSKTASEAYLPMLFPGLILALSYLISMLLETKFKVIVFTIFIALIVANVYFIRSQNYLAGKPGGFGPGIGDRVKIAKRIITLSGGQDFNIKLKGPGSQFASSTMNYEYLIWWLSRKEPNKNSKNVFVISENNNSIKLNTLHR